MPASFDLEPTLAELRAACADFGIVIGWDSTVTEPDAARLLHKSPWTLRNWRHGSRPLAFLKIGGRIRYYLVTLAAFIAEGREIDE